VNPVGYLETGVLVCDDNLRALAQLPSDCVDLIYLDPPFFSNRNYEVIWGDEAEVRSFEDRWEGGIQVYLEWMEARLRHMHRIVKASGSLYLHCDPNASHYLKVMADGIFGGGNFRNEIIWKRYGAHSDAKGYGRVHDVILFYGGGAGSVYFEKQHQPYDPEYVAQRFRFSDPDGRRWSEQNLASPNPRPNLTYAFTAKNGITYDPPPNGWKYTPERMAELDAQNRLHYPAKRGGRLRLKNYMEEMPGVPVQDVWTDIGAIGGTSPERIGYPTQKPEALMERIIRSSCPPDGIVLDPFCGCGTTVAVAEQLQRQWVGIDVSPQAVEIVKLRLNKLGAAPTVYGLPTSADELRRLDPFEFQHWIIQRVMGTPSPRDVADGGIDGFSFFEQLPIQVKKSERVGRKVIDEFETAVARTGKHMGYVVAFSFTKNAYEEVAAAKRAGRPEIVLVKVEDVIAIGDLIDSADREGRAPDLSRVSPDLMGLFSALQQAASERPFSPAGPREAKPSAQALVKSVRERQQRLPVER
jgi:DNA modification methylase